VTVLASSVPYGTTTPVPLPLYVSESDPVPSVVAMPAESAFTALSPLLIASTRRNGDPVRVPLEPRVDAFGPLVFSLVGVSPLSATYESVYVDPGENDLVVEGIDILDITYTVSIRATDAFGQWAEFDIVIHNVAPPAAIDPATDVTLVYPPPYTARPIVIVALADYFTSDHPLALVRFSIAVEPCDYPVRATYSSVASVATTYSPIVYPAHHITVTAFPTTVRLTAYDSLGQASLVPKVFRVV